MHGESLPLIFGLKLRHLREGKGYGLKALAQRVGLSVSYLNEIEKGKKYPKADKILQLAAVLDTEYDDLVSLRLGQPYSAVSMLLESPIMRALPLSVIGLTPRDVLDLVIRAPREVGALLHTLADIAVGYDMHVEHFFYAMVRAYQIAHDNYFEDIEAAAEQFRARHGAADAVAMSRSVLHEALAREHGVQIELNGLDAYPELSIYRSVWIKGPPERLLLNPRLTPRQKDFQISREIGYRELALGARGITSSRSEPASFEQVLNDFKASYYAGAVLLGRDTVLADLRASLHQESWDGPSFLDLMEHYEVTPEMFLYRMSQLLPRFFGFSRLHFYRVTHDTAQDTFELTKQLALGGHAIPAGTALTEHYCRRWVPLELLRSLAGEQSSGSPQSPRVSVQRAHFSVSGEVYWTLAVARPLALSPDTHACVVLGFLMDETFKRRVRFWNDLEVPQVDVNPTCERCDFSPAVCPLRAAPDTIPARQRAREAQQSALRQLIHPTTL